MTVFGFGLNAVVSNWYWYGLVALPLVFVDPDNDNEVWGEDDDGYESIFELSIVIIRPEPWLAEGQGHPLSILWGCQLSVGLNES